jgi:hypothetical protein
MAVVHIYTFVLAISREAIRTYREAAKIGAWINRFENEQRVGWLIGREELDRETKQGPISVAYAMYVGFALSPGKPSDWILNRPRTDHQIMRVEVQNPTGNDGRYSAIRKNGAYHCQRFLPLHERTCELSWI